MNEHKENGNGFVGFEYMKIKVSRERYSMYLDGYESFGWRLDTNFPEMSEKIGELHLCRDRKIPNKMELTRLQRNFEACMKELDVLEESKTKTPGMVALTTGLIGTVFMAGSVFAVTAKPPIVWLCVVLAVPGVIGWGLPCILFGKLVRKRTEIVTPLLEQKYDEIYGLCKKGHDLLE